MSLETQIATMDKPEKEREALMCLECLFVDYLDGTTERGTLEVTIEMDA